MLAVDTISLTPSEAFQLLVLALFGATGLSIRSRVLDGIAKMRFLIGFANLVAKASKDITVLLDELEGEGDARTKKIVIRVRAPFAKINSLADDLLSVNPGDRTPKFDSALVERIERMLRDHEQSTPRKDNTNAAG